MKNKLFSLLLVFTVLFASVPFQAFAAAGENGAVSPDGVSVSATAEKTANENEFEITLTANGSKQAIQNNADIVLLIDKSADMYKSKDKIKSAANSFISKVLSASNNGNRVAVVSFGDRAKTEIALTGDASLAHNAISNIEFPWAFEATFTQDAMHTANLLLKDSKAKNKIIVMLSNGEPTVSYKPNMDDAYVHCDGKLLCHNTTWYNTKKITSCDYSDILFTLGTGVFPEYNHVFLLKCNRGWPHTTSVSISYRDIALYEATIAKNSGIKYYTIGYNVSKNAQSFLQSVGNNGGYFGAKDLDELNDVFCNLGNRLEDVILSSTITATIGAQFELVNGGTAVVSDSNRKLTWNTGAIHCDTPVTLKYTVRLKDGFASDTDYLTGTAALKYNQGSTINYTMPSVKGIVAPQIVAVRVQHVYFDNEDNVVSRVDGDPVDATVGTTFDTSTIAPIETTIDGINYVYYRRSPDFVVNAENKTMVIIGYKPAPEVINPTLTTVYVLEGGTDTKENGSTQIPAGAPISASMLRPDVNGYTFKSGNYSALVSSEAGFTMPQNNATITLTYTKNDTPVETKYTLTVKYVLSDGATKADSTFELKENDPITNDMKQPAIDGYDFKSGDYSALVQNGTGFKMPQDNATITLTYTKNDTPVETKYTLTVKYVLPGEAKKDDSTFELKANDPITDAMKQPHIDGYVFESGDYSALKSIEGLYAMPENSATITLTYKLDGGSSEPTQQPNLTIKYTLANGTVIKTSTSKPIKAGADITAELVAPTISNYVFSSGDYSQIIKDGPQYFMPEKDATVTLLYTKSGGGSTGDGGSTGGNSNNDNSSTSSTVPEVVQPDTVPLATPTPAPSAPAPTSSAPASTEVVKNGAVPLASPKTGEATSVLSIFGVMAVSAACITILKKRKDDGE